MRSRCLFVSMCLSVLVSAGCSTQPAVVDDDAPPAAEPAGSAIVDTPPATMGCDPAPVQSLIGQPATAGLQAQARTVAGAATVRTLAPNQPVTREYMEGRLNLQVDDGNRVTGAYCG